ncbi:hypothetical protein GOODEAATRI_011483 [Goodea atripinnis]|uniref:Uncharacterized protein n=1 Tax=Goodea atripinnis TaxID=208336 RepID=A0ABV0PDD0_9TELE
MSLIWLVANCKQHSLRLFFNNCASSKKARVNSCLVKGFSHSRNVKISHPSSVAAYPCRLAGAHLQSMGETQGTLWTCCHKIFGHYVFFICRNDRKSYIGL